MDCDYQLIFSSNVDYDNVEEKLSALSIRCLKGIPSEYLTTITTTVENCKVQISPTATVNVYANSKTDVFHVIETLEKILPSTTVDGCKLILKNVVTLPSRLRNQFHSLRDRYTEHLPATFSKLRKDWALDKHEMRTRWVNDSGDRPCWEYAEGPVQDFTEGSTDNFHYVLQCREQSFPDSRYTPEISSAEGFMMIKIPINWMPSGVLVASWSS